jgi:hypothetical protein
MSRGARGPGNWEIVAFGKGYYLLENVERLLFPGFSEILS